MTAQFVAMANGPLSRPKLPGIPGIDEFTGPHVPHQPLGLRLHRRRLQRRTSTGLADKRVGIIGTGATAIQCIPHLGECGQAALRLPAHAVVGRRPQQPARPIPSGRRRWSRAGSSGGWTTSTSLVSGGDAEDDLVADGWTDIFRNLTGIAAKTASRKLGRRLTPQEKAELMELADFQKMESVRARVDDDRRGPGDGRGAQAVVPPVLQAALLPRRVPADLQPAQRPPGRHRRQGRRAADRARRRGRRHRVRGRLPHLRHRLRGRHHLHPAGRLRHHRARRADAVGEVGRRAAHAARPAVSTASRTASSSGFTQTARHRQRAARAERAGQARGLHPRPGPPAGRRDGGDHRRGASRRGSTRCASKARLAERFYAACTPGYYNNEGAPREPATASSPACTGPARCGSSSSSRSGGPTAPCPASSSPLRTDALRRPLRRRASRMNCEEGGRRAPPSGRLISRGRGGAAARAWRRCTRRRSNVTSPLTMICW